MMIYEVVSVSDHAPFNEVQIGLKMERIDAETLRDQYNRSHYWQTAQVRPIWVDPPSAE